MAMSAFDVLNIGQDKKKKAPQPILATPAATSSYGDPASAPPLPEGHLGKVASPASPTNSEGWGSRGEFANPRTPPPTNSEGWGSRGEFASPTAPTATTGPRVRGRDITDPYNMDPAEFRRATSDWSREDAIEMAQRNGMHMNQLARVWNRAYGTNLNARDVSDLLGLPEDHGVFGAAYRSQDPRTGSFGIDPAAEENFRSLDLNDPSAYWDTNTQSLVRPGQRVVTEDDRITLNDIDYNNSGRRINGANPNDVAYPNNGSSGGSGGILSRPNYTPNVSYNEPEGYRPSEDDLVEGRMNSLMNNSLLRQTAEREGMAFANRRGLPNSTIAAGEVSRQLFDQARQIAEPDSRALVAAGMQEGQGRIQGALADQAYRSAINQILGQEAASSRLSDQDFRQAMQLSEQDFQEQYGLSKQDFAHRHALATQQEGIESRLAEQQYGYTDALNRQAEEFTTLRQETELELRRFLTTAELASSEANAIEGAVQAYGRDIMNYIANIRQSLDLTPEAKDEIASELMNMYRSYATSSAAVYGVQLDWEE